MPNERFQPVFDANETTQDLRRESERRLAWGNEPHSAQPVFIASSEAGWYQPDPLARPPAKTLLLDQGVFGSGDSEETLELTAATQILPSELQRVLSPGTSGDLASPGSSASPTEHRPGLAIRQWLSNHPRFSGQNSDPSFRMAEAAAQRLGWGQTLVRFAHSKEEGRRWLLMVKIAVGLLSMVSLVVAAQTLGLDLPSEVDYFLYIGYVFVPFSLLTVVIGLIRFRQVKQTRLVLCEGGLVFQTAGNLKTVDWEHVRELRSNMAVSWNEGTSRFVGFLRFRDSNQGLWEINQHVEHLPFVIEMIENATFSYRFQQAKSQLQATGKSVFDAFCVTNDGVEQAGKFVAWKDVRNIRRNSDNDWVVLDKQAKAQLEAPVERVADADVFQTLGTQLFQALL
jgi:hypothetical protein